MPVAAVDNYYPSVTIVEKAFQPGASVTPSVNTIGAFIGKASQGPTTPTSVSSWAGFLNVYGTNYTDLHAAVSDYFNNGGQYAYIIRIPGYGSTIAAVNVYANDAPEDPQNPGSVLPGTPPLFTVTALNPGAWANRLYVAMYARDTLNKRFDLAVYNVPTGQAFDPSKRNSELQLEQWTDVTLDKSDPRYVYDVINAPSSTGSLYVSLSGQSYDPATPATRPFPNTTTAKQLVGGDDGSYLAPYDSVASYNAAVLAMQGVAQPYILNIPNVTDPNVIKYAVTTAAARGNVFVVIDAAVGQSPVDMVTYAANSLALPSIGTSLPSFAALYYPQVYLPSLGASSPGKLSLRPAGGAVVGMMMGIDSTQGPWKAPSGMQALLAGAGGLERKLNDADMTALSNAHVNALKQFQGLGVAVWGTRTLKSFGLDQYINIRRSIIYLRTQLVASTQFALFETNNSFLWNRLTTVCNSVLGKFWSSGGLTNSKAADAFYVKCDETNNPPSSQQQGVVNIEVGIAFAAPAEFIIITIGQFDGGAVVSTSI